MDYRKSVAVVGIALVLTVGACATNDLIDTGSTARQAAVALREVAAGLPEDDAAAWLRAAEALEAGGTVADAAAAAGPEAGPQIAAAITAAGAAGSSFAGPYAPLVVLLTNLAALVVGRWDGNRIAEKQRAREHEAFDEAFKLPPPPEPSA